MNECGVYRVLDKRLYRGHEKGTEFPARLDKNAERRAIMRGSIERIGSVILRAENFTFPDGWLSGQQDPDQRGAERPLSH